MDDSFHRFAALYDGQGCHCGADAHHGARAGRGCHSRECGAAGGDCNRTPKGPVYTPEYKAEIIASQALKRDILPDDVARLVLFLAADDSSAITNQSYVVDG